MKIIIKSILIILISSFIINCGMEESSLHSSGNQTADTDSPNFIVSASAGDSQVTINWNNVSDATSYNVYMDTLIWIL